MLQGIAEENKESKNNFVEIDKIISFLVKAQSLLNNLKKKLFWKIYQRK
jgi:hypothetical protein